MLIQIYLTLDGSSQRAMFNKDVYLNTGIDIVFEGGTSNSNETTLTVVDPTADRTITHFQMLQVQLLLHQT